MNAPPCWGHSGFPAKRKNRSVPDRQQGLTYVEVLVATLILLIGLVPALDALRNAVTGAAGNETYVNAQHRLGGRFEEVLAEPFATLDAAALAAGSYTTPSSYSEAPGTPGRLIVYLSRYDGDDADGNGNPFNGGDEGLLWVRAEVENTPYAIETLVSQ